MEQHFNIVGGKLLSSYCGFSILVSPTSITFRSPNKRFTYPLINNNGKFFKDRGMIFYKNGDRTHCFDTTSKTNKDVCKWYSNIIECYSCNGDYYLQFSKCIVRISDGAIVNIRSKTKYVIEGNNNYTDEIILYKTYTFVILTCNYFLTFYLTCIIYLKTNI
jgi:hypothetical protein